MRKPGIEGIREYYDKEGRKAGKLLLLLNDAGVLQPSITAGTQIEG